MSEVSFKLEEVKEKPRRTYRKGSKYDPIIDRFLEGKSKLVKVEVLGKNTYYVLTQLKKRIEARGCGNKVEVSLINKTIYLEKFVLLENAVDSIA